MQLDKAYRIILLALLILSWLASLSSTLIAQNKAEGTLTQSNNCEDALLYYDMTVLEARKDKGSYIILIARLGEGERSQKLSQRRLKDAKDYLDYKGEDKIVIAYGERVKGHGRVEMYVSGKLLYALRHPRNSYIDCRGL